MKAQLALAAGVAIAGLVALVGSNRKVARRRLHEAEALRPEHLRKWVAKGDEPSHVVVAAHGRTTGYTSAAVERIWLDGHRRDQICATAYRPDVQAATTSVRPPAEGFY